jgi:perosamine synthetase
MVRAGSTLAALGGRRAVVEPVRDWPEGSPEDDAAVMAVQRAPGKELGTPLSEFLTAFEGDYAEYMGMDFAVALGNGTDALAGGLIGLGVQVEEPVAMSVHGFGLPQAAHMIGARPVWVDIDPKTYNMDLTQLERVVNESGARVVGATHLHGLSLEMDPLMEIITRRKLGLVEDFAQSLGVRYRGRLVGTFGDSGASSENGAKILSTEDGGVFVTNDPGMAEAVRRAFCFGTKRVRTAGYQTSAHRSEYMGRNSRMTQTAASVGRSRLKRVDAWSQVAKRNGEALIAGLSELPGIVPPYIPDGCESNFHLFRVRVDAEALGWTGSIEELRDRIMWALHCEGVAVDFWMPMLFPEMPAFRRATARFWYPGIKEEPLSPYDPEEFPNGTAMLRATFVLGRVAWQVQSPKLVRQYINAFAKVIENITTVFTM